jgi:hypothetical protein
LNRPQATIACFVVIVSLVHFLMALSANYAHIRGHDKFSELQAPISRISASSVNF